MAGPTVQPYGTWRSPITSELIATGSVRFSDATFYGDGILWLESRPLEGGRIAIVQRRSDGTINDLIDAPLNARTRVHEYGGGAIVLAPEFLLFSNFTDQRLYRIRTGAAPEPITSEGPLRYADGILDAARSRVICVREDHSQAGSGKAEAVINTIAAVPLAAGHPQQILVAGSDFYASPRLSPDGHQLCWLQWNHPNMPWDGNELWLAEVDGKGALHNARIIAGSDHESIFQPTWSPDGVLTFASDQSGWWNLYRWEDGGARCVLEMQAEFGAPQWALGPARFAYISSKVIVCVYSQSGCDHLAQLDVETGSLHPIPTPLTSINSLSVKPGLALVVGGGPSHPPAVALIDLESGSHTLIRQSAPLAIDPGFVSIPEAVEFPTEDALTAYGWFYRPLNRDYVAPHDEKPPLLVISHGGPTGSTSNALSWSVQYWTSRGFAVLDVNYRGSTGYGRAYREQLYGQWGNNDVIDCIWGAEYLVQQGWVDERRMAIRGGSAGGYTTLCALAFHRVFTAGASYYGVSDLEALALDTHKFESRYLDRLVGPYPERRDLYLQRSPIYHVDGLSCPVIFFQGLEDKVVPPAQAERMVTALREKGLPVAYLAFEGEQHGFRRAENIRRALDAELFFYSRIFGFVPAGQIEAIKIWNL